MHTKRQFLPTKLLMAAFLMLVTTLSFAQDCSPYFPLKQGTTYTMKNYDKKDKLEGTSEQTIVKKTTNGGNVEAKVDITHYDKKDKVVAKGDYTVSCKNGSVEIDMSNLISNMTQLYNTGGMDVKVDGDVLDLPAELKAGQELKGGKITASISNMGMNIFKTTVVISDRKVEGFETVTTPAGSFECAKISYISRAQVMIKTVETKVVEYYSKDVGMVKSEHYKLKDNSLQGYSQLESIE